MPLDPGDEIVSAVSFNGYVLVFTRLGVVWKVVDDARSGGVTFMKVS